MWLKRGRRGSLSIFASWVSNEVPYVAQMIFWKAFVWLVPLLKACKSDQQVEKHEKHNLQEAKSSVDIGSFSEASKQLHKQN